MKLNCIYPAFMGECNKFGIGVPCTFVRLSGCNLRCYSKTMRMLCDTPEALSMETGVDASIDDILYEVRALKNQVVCLTGGEPFLQDCHKLIETLLKYHFKVVVETNGSVSVAPYTDLREMGDITFVVDVKAPSSGEMYKMLEGNYKCLGKGDFVKFVLYDCNDYDEMIKWLDTHRSYAGRVGVGLFWGSKLHYRTLIDFLIKDKVPVYLNMQAHKMCCLYDAHKNNLNEITIPKNL